MAVLHTELWSLPGGRGPTFPRWGPAQPAKPPQLPWAWQRYKDLQPRFLRELHQAGHEQLPELRAILEESFLQDEAGRWYVPDPARAQDLERLRERALSREFREYVAGRGRLKVFRSEAVRAGFRDAWRRRDYAVIVSVAQRLPERVVQEDADLLMYYDNALMRMETA